MTSDNLTTYAKQRGIQLHKDDIVFIRALLSPMDRYQRQDYLKRYFEIWRDAMQSPGMRNAQNAGRHAANTWLREILSKHVL